MLCAIFISFGQPALALGISPSGTMIPNVMRGIPRDVTVFVSREADDGKDEFVSVSAKGEIAEYLKFEPSFIIPGNKPGIDFTFQIDPGAAQSGEHSGLLSFVYDAEGGKALSDGDKPVGMSIKSGVSLTVWFKVSGEEVVSFSLLSSAVHDTESNLKPVVTYQFENTGNVNWKPDHADLSISSEDDPSFIEASSLGPDKFRNVSPGRSDSLDIELDKPLPEGTYKLHTSFFDASQKQIGEMTTANFSVLAPGTLAQTGELKSATANKDAFATGEKILLTGEFSNTGQVPVTAQMMTSVERDGTYVDVVRGEELRVEAGGSTSFSNLIEPTEAGTYRLSSYVKFGNKKTSTIDVSVVVSPPKGIVKAADSNLGIGILSAAIILGTLVLVLVRRKRRQAAVPVVVVQAPAAPVPAVPVVPPAPSETKPSDEPVSDDGADRRW